MIRRHDPEVRVQAVKPRSGELHLSGHWRVTGTSQGEGENSGPWTLIFIEEGEK